MSKWLLFVAVQMNSVLFRQLWVEPRTATISRVPVLTDRALLIYHRISSSKNELSLANSLTRFKISHFSLLIPKEDIGVTDLRWWSSVA